MEAEINELPRGGAFKVVSLVLGVLCLGLAALVALFEIPTGRSPGIWVPTWAGYCVGAVIFVPGLFVLVARLLARPFSERSKWKAITWGLALSLLSLGSQAGRIAAGLASGDASVMPHTTATSQWTAFETDRFAVELPGQPTEKRDEGSLGLQLIKPDAGFVAAYTEVAEGDQMQERELFDAYAQNFSQRLGGHVTESRAVFHAGLIGREYALAGLQGGLVARVRVFWRSPHVYSLVVNGTDPLDDAVVTRFFDSFGLTAGVPTKSLRVGAR